MESKNKLNGFQITTIILVVIVCLTIIFVVYFIMKDNSKPINISGNCPENYMMVENKCSCNNDVLYCADGKEVRRDASNHCEFIKC